MFLMSKFFSKWVKVYPFSEPIVFSHLNPLDLDKLCILFFCHSLLLEYT